MLPSGDSVVDVDGVWVVCCAVGVIDGDDVELVGSLDGSAVGFTEQPIRDGVRGTHARWQVCVSLNSCPVHCDPDGCQPMGHV